MIYGNKDTNSLNAKHGGKLGSISKGENKHHWTKGSCIIKGDSMHTAQHERKLTTDIQSK